MDVEGNVVDMPSEPAESGLCAKVKHRAYPCREAGGFVWIWMGEREHVLPFEPPRVRAHREHEGQHRPLRRAVQLGADPRRRDRLGAQLDACTRPTCARARRRREGDRQGVVAVRRPTKRRGCRCSRRRSAFATQRSAGRSSTRIRINYVRITLFVAPITVLIPPNDQYNLANVNVPIDDTHTMFHFIAWNESGDGHRYREAGASSAARRPGIDLDAGWEPRRTLDNHHLQDRQAMKLGDFTGIRGIPMQDMAMWASMGPITDRTRDRLGASDVAIVEFRRIMLDAGHRIRCAAGHAIGTQGATPMATLRAFEGVIPKADDWRTLGRVAGALEKTSLA